MEERTLKLQSAAKRYVHSTGRWCKFFAVVSIVGMSLFTLCGVLLILCSCLGLDAAMNGAVPAGCVMPMWVIGAIYLVSAGLMLPAVIYLMRAAKAARTAVALNDNEAALRYMRCTKSYWKYYGILTIVMLGICAVGIPVAVVLGVVLM